MAENSKIEWTHHTFNPFLGCCKVSPGCKNCYAETLAKGRMQLAVWGPTAGRQPRAESAWLEPLRWDKAAAALGERHRVFSASMADVFEGPETCQDPGAYAVIEEGRRRLFETIAKTPNLDWLLLTKRPQNMVRFAPLGWEKEWPRNVWAGTSVEDQATADERIPCLLQVPAVVRFLSCEPLLGPIDLPLMRCAGCFRWTKSVRVNSDKDWGCADCFCYAKVGFHMREDGISWVIAGGESGSGARPMHPDWVRGIRDQCDAANVPFLFKQWGEFRPYSDWDHIECKSADQYAVGPGGEMVTHRLSVQCSDRYGKDAGFALLTRAGKKKAGRVLDGKVWDQFPLVVDGVLQIWGPFDAK